MSVTVQPYGRDTRVIFSPRGARIAYGQMVSGKQLLGQRCLLRLITERGSLLDDPNFGFPLVSLLNKAQTRAGRAAIPGLIRLELKKDDEVDTVDTVFRLDESRKPILTAEVDIHVVGYSVGPFDLGLLVSEVRVEVLRFPEAA